MRTNYRSHGRLCVYDVSPVCSSCADSSADDQLDVRRSCATDTGQSTCGGNSQWSTAGSGHIKTWSETSRGVPRSTVRDRRAIQTTHDVRASLARYPRGPRLRTRLPSEDSRHGSVLGCSGDVSSTRQYCIMGHGADEKQKKKKKRGG